MRKEMPYEFKIIPIDGKIQIINKTIWNNRDFVVEYKMDNNSGTVMLDGQTNSAIIDKIPKKYPILFKIYRRDLKGKIIYRPYYIETPPPYNHTTFIAFVGASIGRDWGLEKFTIRGKLDKISIAYWPQYEFNKKEIIDYIIKFKIKPDIIIIKECAEYFPRDEKESVDIILSWVNLLEKNNIKTLIATTCPVTFEHDRQKRGRQESIQRYNELLRQKGLNILDLERVLASEETSPYLHKSFAQQDGLHITGKGYKQMDEALLEFLATKGIAKSWEK